jgi:hypothetical protein
MLGDLYYFFTLILIIFNILFIANFFRYYKIVEWFHTFKKVTGRIPKKEDFEKDDFELNSFLSSVILFNLTWIFFGILSKSWIIYLTLLVSMPIVILFQSIISRIFGQFSLILKIISLLFWILLTSVLVILTINHHHLHLELSDYIFNIFK